MSPRGAALALERFTATPITADVVLLEVAGGLTGLPARAGRPRLLAETPEGRREHAPLDLELAEGRLRAAFAVSSDALHGEFALAAGGLLLELPAPDPAASFERTTALARELNALRHETAELRARVAALAREADLAREAAEARALAAAAAGEERTATSEAAATARAQAAEQAAQERAARAASDAEERVAAAVREAEERVAAAERVAEERVAAAERVVEERVAAAERAAAARALAAERDGHRPLEAAGPRPRAVATSLASAPAPAAGREPREPGARAVPGEAPTASPWGPPAEPEEATSVAAAARGAEEELAPGAAGEEAAPADASDGAPRVAPPDGGPIVLRRAPPRPRGAPLPAREPPRAQAVRPSTRTLAVAAVALAALLVLVTLLGVVL